MNRFRQIIAFAAFTVICSLCSAATTPGVTFLFTDGSKASFAFSSTPKIAMSTNGLTVSASGKDDASYQFSDVQRYYFENDIETGIARIAATSPEGSHPVFRYANGAVAVSGLRPNERIRVASISGASVKTYTANADGTVKIDLSSSAFGVYAISTDSGVSFKIANK